MAGKIKLRKIKITLMSMLTLLLLGATAWAIYLGCARRRRTCPYGTYRSGNVCVRRARKCPSGYIYRGGNCVDPKLKPLRANPMNNGGGGAGSDGTDL